MGMKYLPENLTEISGMILKITRVMFTILTQPLFHKDSFMLMQCMMC